MIPVRLFLAFAFGYFLAHVFRVVNAVAGPEISADIGIDTAALGFLTSVYFLSFAAAQLPLGVLLDRYGANRVQGGLLIIAAAGAAIFALGDDLATLSIGRALIGLGVSSGLMSAFKAYSTRLPAERLPLANGLHMAAGSLGVLAGGLPVELAMQTLGWRGVFACLAVLCLFAAAILLFGVRETKIERASDSFGVQLASVAKVFISPAFVRLAPLSVAIQASALATMALWIGPWLREVASFTPDEAATIVSLVGVAMIVGFVLCAVATNRLVALGVPLTTVMIGGYLAHSAMLPLIILINPAWAAPVWLAYALLVSFAPLSFPVLGALYPASQTGRVHTALNFLVFTFAFGLQWGFGVVVEALTPALGVEGAYDAALWVLAGLHAASYAWYVVRRPVQSATMED